ncbi:STAS domain-containing protein [Streptomyces sp. NPDC058914]|uniref:STAS domain-containing protein n=1 Tax=Streptomyces TaxID=1883 RepID=UPI0036792452
MIAECLSRDLTVLILDLTALEACDEAGLHVLTGAAASLEMIGGCLHLAGAPEQLHTLAGREALPACHDDVDTAVTAVRAAEANDAE